MIQILVSYIDFEGAKIIDVIKAVVQTVEDGGCC